MNKQWRMLMLVTAINDVHQYLKNELVNRQLKAENWQPNIPDKTYEVIFFSYRTHGNLTPLTLFQKDSAVCQVHPSNLPRWTTILFASGSCKK